MLGGVLCSYGVISYLVKSVKLLLIILTSIYVWVGVWPVVILRWCGGFLECSNLLLCNSM